MRRERLSILSTKTPIELLHHGRTRLILYAVVLFLLLLLFLCVESHDVQGELGDLTATELEPMGNVAEVAVEIVLICVALEEIRLSYQVVYDIGLFFFIFEVSYLRSSVGRISHVRGYTDEVFIALRILHPPLARAYAKILGLGQI